MKIGIITDELDPRSGGGTVFQEEILRALGTIERHIFEILAPPEAAERIRELGLPEHIEVSSLRRPSVPRRVANVVGRAVPDVRKGVSLETVVDRRCREREIEFLWYVTPYRLEIPDVPYMAMVFDLQHRVQPWFPEVSARGEWDRREQFLERFLRRAAIVVAANETGKNEVVDLYGVPPARILALPHPTPSFADEELGGDDDDVLLRLAIPGRYLFYPAQFWPHKNHVVLLHALAALENDVHVVFTGSDSGNRKYVEDVAQKLGVESRVHFPGLVARRDLVALYRRALALVYPSFFGPENLPPLEAFALGCPVIAASVEGANQQIGDAALLVDPRDEEAWAGAVQSIMRDQDLRASLVRNGRERARWTTGDFVRAVGGALDDFEKVRRSWQ